MDDSQAVGPLTLAIDIGGTRLKAGVLDSTGTLVSQAARTDTPHPSNPGLVIDMLATLVAPLGRFDRVSVGFPGVVRHGVVITAPNLGTPVWQGARLAADLSSKFERPVRLLNDASVQGLGVIGGNGLECVITLGTGMGFALFQDGRLMPHLELSQHPVRKLMTYDQYIGNAALHDIGRKRWNRRVQRAIGFIETLTSYDTLYVGGGNAKAVTFELPQKVQLVSNEAGITGGIRLWDHILDESFVEPNNPMGLRWNMPDAADRPVPDPDAFDEAFYLASNPDVAAVVEAGFIPNGWFHYEAHGYGEGRLGAPTDDLAFESWPDAPPVPESGTLDEGLLAEKGRIEVAMRGSPRNLGLREGYFDVLWMISGSHFGAFFANLPELRTPLMFRGGSSDVLNMRQIYIDNWVGEHDFQYGDYGVPFPTPQRVLDLGAYCGYTAVYFANRFPDADIIAVEPSTANFAVLRANAAPYPNIRCVNAAVWHTPTRVAATAHYFGDWGTQFDISQASAQETLPGHTIARIMAMNGWDHVDFIKCILEGEQVPVLAAEDRPWLDRVTCVATKPTPAGSFPREEDESRLRMAFARPRFDTFRHGEMFFFVSRNPLPPPSVPVLRLAPPPPARRRYGQEHVDGALVFHRFGENGIHLAPNAPGSPDCRIVFTVHVAGQTRFESGIVAHWSDGGTVTFAVVIEDASTNVVLHAEQRTLPVDTREDWSFEFAPLEGVCVIILSTAREGQDGLVGADFLDPRLT